ncbi:MBL fold metallo-hydrolase, partial [Streptococcus danieliae]|nr:MBL fold metallo-hydrolase [Streptococcus danieliae]
AGFYKIKDKVESKFLKVEAIILTHTHFDHIVSLEETRRYFGVPVYVSSKENEWLKSPELNLSSSFGLNKSIRTNLAEFEFENYREYE